MPDIVRKIIFMSVDNANKISRRQKMVRPFGQRPTFDATHVIEYVISLILTQSTSSRIHSGIFPANRYILFAPGAIKNKYSHFNLASSWKKTIRNAFIQILWPIIDRLPIYMRLSVRKWSMEMVRFGIIPQCRLSVVAAYLQFQNFYLKLNSYNQMAHEKIDFGCRNNIL